MYKITKTIEISAAHRLVLPYESKCKAEHGHNYLITVELRSQDLNTEGMIGDFSHVAEIVNKYDHSLLNDFFSQPTAELIAHELWRQIDEKYPGKCRRVVVQEDRDNVAEYVQD